MDKQTDGRTDGRAVTSCRQMSEQHGDTHTQAGEAEAVHRLTCLLSELTPLREKSNEGRRERLRAAVFKMSLLTIFMWFAHSLQTGAGSGSKSRLIAPSDELKREATRHQREYLCPNVKLCLCHINRELSV